MKLDTGTQLEPAQVKALVKAYFKEALDRLEKQMDSAHKQTHIMALVAKAAEKNTGQSFESFIEKHQARLDYLVPANYKFAKDADGKRHGTMFSPFYFDGNTDEVLKYVLEENDLDLNSYSPSYQGLKKGVVRAVEELKRQHQQRMDFETDIKIEDEWFSETQSDPIAKPVSASPHMLSECFEQFMDEHIEGEKKTNAKRRISFDLWIELFGDGTIDTITKDNVREYRETLKKYPKHRSMKYAGFSIEELKKLNLHKSERIAIGTINSYLDMTRGFVHWLKDWKGFTDNNPFSKVNIKDNIPDSEKRDAFSQDQLIKIFSTPVYQGCKSHTTKGQYIEGDKIYKNSKFWLPLLGLYSGARLGELCQLYSKDVYQEDGVWLFDINKDEEDKTAKTKGSFRKVPIHPFLIELGFVEYVKKHSDRIFPDVHMAADKKYSSTVSKRFATFLKKFDIKTNKTAFHSFRHNFIQTMTNETDIPEEVWESITGHTNSKPSRGYRGDIGIKKKYEAIKQLKFEGVESLLLEEG